MRYRYYVLVAPYGRTVVKVRGDVPNVMAKSHPKCYMVGPFKTERGAIYMRDHGRNNPHCVTVAQAETLAGG